VGGEPLRASLGRRGVGEQGVGGGVPADPGEGERVDDDCGLVVVVVLRLFRAGVVELGAARVPAGLAQGAFSRFRRRLEERRRVC